VGGIEKMYNSMISGETQFKYGGDSLLRGNGGGYREDGGPADVKKTFLYNQRLTTSVF
jgi:hypothetical protein